MKKFLAILLTAYCLLFTYQASAHVVKSDGNIGVTIHVNPDDDPIVGQPASFFLEIVDKTDKFKPTDCNCIATITENGNQIYSTALFTGTQANDVSAAPFFSYTFPEKNIYTVKISGSPKTSDAFQTFSISYDLRVARDARTPAKTSSSTLWLYIGVGIMTVGIIIFFLRKK
jgi:hypothetical protein